jgi:hypothetical protein
MTDWSCRKGLDFGPDPLSPLPDVFGQHGTQYVAPGSRIEGGLENRSSFRVFGFLRMERDGGWRYQATGSPEVKRRKCIIKIVYLSPVLQYA